MSLSTLYRAAKSKEESVLCKIGKDGELECTAVHDYDDGMFGMDILKFGGMGFGGNSLSLLGLGIFKPSSPSDMMKMNFVKTLHFLNQFVYEKDTTLGQKLQETAETYKIEMNINSLAIAVNEITMKLPHEIIYWAAGEKLDKINEWIRKYTDYLINLVEKYSKSHTPFQDSALGALFMSGHGQLGVHGGHFTKLMHSAQDSFIKQTTPDNVDNVTDTLAKANILVENLEKHEYISKNIKMYVNALLTDIQNALNDGNLSNDEVKKVAMLNFMGFDYLLLKIIDNPSVVRYFKVAINREINNSGYKPHWFRPFPYMLFR